MKLRVVLIKPSKYGLDGSVERFRFGYLPNTTLPYIRSMVPAQVGEHSIEVITIDEYIQKNCNYLKLLRAEQGIRTMVAMVGVQSHQFHRALDLAALAHSQGCQAIIGGPHPMTCDTSMLWNMGVSFSLAEAEVVLEDILADMAGIGELKPVYGSHQRWALELNPPPMQPLSRVEQKSHILPMMGLYPTRGCPFDCSYCSIVKIAGRRMRSEPVATTIQSLKAGVAAGIRMFIFCSDNFNKYEQARELLIEMVKERLPVKFFCQCDAQIGQDPDLIELLARAGCFQIFVGTESFSRKTLKEVRKGHNHPDRYANIVKLCNRWGISTHFSNIVGFAQEGESEILDHLRQLSDIAPTIASFSTLTPTPGTDQYEEFLEAGWITDPNLDRFDGNTVIWQHPSLTHAQLEDLTLKCYREFYTLKHIRRVLSDWHPIQRNPVRDMGMLTGYTLYSQYSARHKYNPMSGGVWRTKADHVREYLSLRKQYFNCETVPLPRNLRLSEQEARLNTKLNPTVKISV